MRYVVTVETSGRELYLVEADSPEQALAAWESDPHFDPIVSEVLSAEAVSAKLDA